MSQTRSWWPEWAGLLVGKSCQRCQRGLRSLELKPSVCRDRSICSCFLCRGSTVGARCHKAVATSSDSCCIRFAALSWKEQSVNLVQTVVHRRTFDRWDEWGLYRVLQWGCHRGWEREPRSGKLAKSYLLLSRDQGLLQSSWGETFVSYSFPSFGSISPESCF